MKKLSNIIKKAQQKIITDINNTQSNPLLIKSIPLTGKTTIINSLFEKDTSNHKIFITGCPPDKMKLINDYLIAEIDLILNKTNSNVTLFSDEYYNNILLNYLIKKKIRIRSIITTNMTSIDINDKIKTIDIYKDIMTPINQYLIETYNESLQSKINQRKISLSNICMMDKYLKKKKIIKFDYNRLSKVMGQEITRKDDQRFEPNITSLIYVNENFTMYKSFEFGGEN